VRVLGIDVPDELLVIWRRVLAPEWQPFFVERPEEWPAPRPPAGVALTAELRDTYTVWRLRRAAPVVWFDEASFLAMPRAERARLVRSQVEIGRGAVPTVRRWQTTFAGSMLREQADGHRFVWWPSLLERHAGVVLADHVQDGQPASRHREIARETWRRCRAVLPNARSLAGSFATSATANCFGTTLAAAGDADGDERILQDRFDAFLAARCAPGGDDGDPGTVLVWRDRSGQPCHSAVTIGDGWAFEKPSQTWWTPRVALAVGQLIRVNRAAGLRLERHRIMAR
jgi:hypothetical protein